MVAAFNALAGDARSLQALRSDAARDPKQVVKEAAKQFEALFMQELMKSMRQAQQSMASGLLDNGGTQMGTEMLDTQLSTKMTGLPGGLGDAIARQLERQVGGAAVAPAAAAGAPAATTKTTEKTAAAARPAAAAGAAQAGTARASDFVAQHQEAARAAEAQTGIPAAFMVSQAAHETGWGRREIRHADGSNAFNLFGIKADTNWKGPTAEVTTTEYIGGVARKVVAKFRAYASYAESFADYARMMKTSPRYSGVVANDGSAQQFAQGLQRAGYATDPAYADKLTRVINTTLRLQRSLA